MCRIGKDWIELITQTAVSYIRCNIGRRQWDGSCVQIR